MPNEVGGTEQAQFFARKSQKQIIKPLVLAQGIMGRQLHQPGCSRSIVIGPVMDLGFPTMSAAPVFSVA